MDNSHLDPIEDMFMSTTVPPPPFPFLWVLCFVVLQLFPWFTFYMLIDDFLNCLVLLAGFIAFRVLVPILEQGQL